MPIIDIEQPRLDEPVDTSKTFTVTPGMDEVTRGSDATPQGWGSSFGDAFRSDNWTGSILSSESAQINTRVEGYHPWPEIKGTKYEPFAANFGGSGSPERTAEIKRNIDAEQEIRKRQDKLPWHQALLTQGAAGVLDWPTLLPGGAFVRGAKGGFSIAKSAAVTGAAAGVGAGVQEAGLQAIQETRTWEESATNIGASIFLGGLLGGGFAKVMSQGEWNRGVRALERELNPEPPVNLARSAPADGPAGSGGIDSPVAIKTPLNERLDAFQAEFLDTPGLSPELRQALEVAAAPFSIRHGTGVVDRAVEAIKWSVVNGRRDIAEAIVERAEKEIDDIRGGKPGVPEDSPKYQAIQERRAADAAAQEKLAEELRGMLGKDDAVASSGVPSSVGAAANTAPSLAENSISGKMAAGVAAATQKINPLLRALHSPSPVYRDIALNLFKNPLYLKQNDHFAASAVSAEDFAGLWNANLAQGILSDQKHYADYIKAGGTLKWSDFLDEVGKSLRRNDTHADPFITKAAKDWRAKVFDPLKEAAIDAGLLKPDVIVTTAPSYFHRMWNRQKIIAKEGDFRNIIQQWVSDNFPKWAQTFDRQTERLIDPLNREIQELEYGKLMRAEEVKQRGNIADTTEMTESDIRQALRIVQGGAPKPKGVDTLSQFVAKAGGLVDMSGELAHRGITNKARPGFVRKAQRTAQSEGGWHLDDMARHAWEKGYFSEWGNERPSIDAFLNALQDDFFKIRAVVPAGQEDHFRLYNLVQQLDADLSRAGVNPTQGTKFSTSEEMQGLVDRVFKALDAEADTKVKALKAKLSERETARRVEREARFMDDPRELGRSIADEVINALTGKTVEGPRPEQITIKARGPLAERTFDIPDHLVEEFLESNVEEVGRRYVRVMSADVELARKFGSVDMEEQIAKIREDYTRMRAMAESESERLKLNQREKDDVDDLKGMRDQLRGIDPGASAEGNYATIVRMANHVNYIRSMGEVALASLGETVRPAMVHGLMPYMETIGQLATNMKGIKMSVAEAQLAGNVLERVLGHRLATLAEIGDPYATRGPIEAFLENMTNFASKWNGIRLLTDMQKSLASVMTQNRILQNAVDYGKIKDAEKRYLAYLSIDESMAGRIAKQFAEHGRTVDKVRVANTNDWTDDVARRTYRAALNQDVDSIITTKGIADVPIRANTPTGKMLLQFKTFALASHQRVLLRGLQEDQTRFLGGVIAMSAVGMMVTYLKAISGNRPEAREKMLNNPGWWAGEGFDRSGIASIPMEIANAFEKPTGFNPIKSPFRAFDSGNAMSQKNQNRNDIGSFLGPTVGGVADALTVGGIPKTVMGGQDVTQGQKNAGERLFPFNSYVGMRQIIRYVVNPPQ